jgi:tetratricopeptide (TPR) repeat protein
MLYDEQKNYELSEDFYKKTITIKKKYKDYYGLLLTYSNISSSYIEQERYDDALTYSLNGLTLSEKENIIKYKITFYNLLDSIYTFTNNKTEALKYKKKYILLYDSINISQDSLIIKSILNNTNDSIYQKVKENKEKYESNLYTKNIIILSILGVLILFLVFVIIIKVKRK